MIKKVNKKKKTTKTRKNQQQIFEYKYQAAKKASKKI